MNAETPAPQHPKRTRGVWRRVALWLPVGLLGVLLSVALAAWVWAGTAGSLALAIGWGQGYMARQGQSAGTLSVAEVTGSLRNGGEIGRLQWQRDELIVQATGVRIALDNRFWLDALLARGLRLSQFDIGRLQITDRRPPTPVEPLQPITLPMAITLPWSVGELVLDGKQELSLSGLKGQYRYRPADSLWNLGVADAHQLDLENLQVAGGLYQIQAVLGAQAPMPLRVDAQGDVKATVPGGEDLVLKAIAKVTGQLAESDAALDATASITTSTSDTPVLDASARIRPWKTQPIETVNARMNRLNLAALWPQAPVTELSGTVVAQPDGDAWRAQVRLTNAVPGPADKQRLPLQSLQADLEQRGARWTLSNLDAQLGGGRVQGQGWRQTAASPLGNFQGELKASRINPAALWSSIAPAALDGTFSARAVNAESANPAIDLSAVVKPSGTQPKAGQLAGLRLRDLNLQGRWTPSPDNAALGVLDLRTLSAGMADATLDGQGQLDVGARSFDGRLALKLPGAQGDWQGRAAHAQGKGELNLALDDASRVLAWVKSLQTLPVVGPLLRAQLEAQPGLQLEGSARLGATWDGGLGVLGYPAPLTGATTPAPPRVQARLQSPRLTVTRGSPARAADPATGTAAVVGTLQTLSLANLNLQASGQPHLLDITATGQAEQGPWRGTLDTQGRLQLGSAQRPDIDSGRLDLSRLQLRATDSARKDRVVDWTLQSVAALGLRWQDARSAINLTADAGQLRLQPSFSNRVGGAPAATPATTAPMTLAWDQLSWQKGALMTRGQLTGLPLSWVDAFTTAEGAKSGPLSQAGLGGDVVFDGSWNLLLPADAATPPRLSAQLQRRSGDLSVQTDGAFDENTTSTQRLQTGIKEARLSVTTQGANVQASLRWDTERLGQATAELGTTLSPPGGDQTAWHWAPDAPLRGTITANLPQVGVWSALAPPGWRVRGTLTASATLSGTRANPLWNGTLQADQLALRSIVNGISFSRGELRATLAGERITIDRFYLQGRGGVESGGTLLASGTTEFRRVTVDGVSQRQPYINLQATATKLRVSSRADRRLTLSGQLQAELVGTALQIRGALRADSALFVLPDESTPSLGADVVVRGTETALETPGAFRVRPDVLIDIDLGDDFQVSGQGLQTRLAGKINVRSTPELPTPRVLGDVRTERGSYRAYGQRLTIENGVLRFTGPYDNPTLDITAVRPNSSQRVGVQISGTAQVPRVRLFSDPELPDSEKLAWLVLGRPASGAGAEAAVLQQAALALLAGRDGRLDGGLASALGLDELSITGSATNADGSAASAALTLGKRLSNNLYLSYERSLAGALGTVSIFYDVTRRLTVRARAGEENALDLIFTIQYD